MDVLINIGLFVMWVFGFVVLAFFMLFLILISRAVMEGIRWRKSMDLAFFALFEGSARAIKQKPRII